MVLRFLTRTRMRVLLVLCGLTLVAVVVLGNLLSKENGEVKADFHRSFIWCCLFEELKQRVQDLESRKKIYPDVKFLTYKDRKRILITGGAGFVGSHLVDKLMMEGHEVTVVDNFFTGRKRNVEHWMGHHNFEILNHDVVNPLYIEVNEIYHLASPASPPHYMYNPLKTIKTNTLGTINMLGLAKRVRAKFLLASTSEVYGENIYAAVLFDADGKTSVVREPKFADDISQLTRSSRTTLLHGGVTYWVEILFIGDQKEAIKAQKDYMKSRRGEAVMESRERRGEGETGGFLDIFPEEVGKFLTSGVVEVVTRQEDKAACCEHCFQTEEVHSKMVEMSEILNIIRDNGNQQNELIKEQNRTLAALNQNIEKLAKNTCNTVDLTFVDGILDTNQENNAGSSSNVSSVDVSSAPSLPDQLLSTFPCIVDAVSSGLVSSRPLVPSVVSAISPVSSLVSSLAPVSASISSSAPSVDDALSVSQVNLPSQAQSVPAPVQPDLPRTVRIGPHKYLYDIGADKGTFNAETGQIADSTIGKALSIADNVRTFCSTLTLALFLPEELEGRCVDGSKVKLALSPRRKNAIRQACMENFNVPNSQRDSLWRRDCREAINKKLRATFQYRNEQ